MHPVTPSNVRPVIAVHGGAGTMSREGAAAEQQAAYHDALRAVLGPARDLLARGGTALDAVSLAVDLLEDCPLFNAGHGAVFTHDETHELDAAVMDGATRKAGAVGCVARIKRPVRAARAVMEHTDHVLLVGAGAEALAERLGLELVSPDYFSTDHRREQLRRALAADKAVLDHDGAALVFRQPSGATPPLDEQRKFGTVGAVALDVHGNLAAATSTGGMTNKRPGRVGDSPLIGAGTYADNATAAISCTGTGEMFIRVLAAYDICARMAYAGATLEQAAEAVVMQALPAIGGRGGLVAVDRLGNVALPFNTEGMYRGVARVGEALQTAIFRDDPVARP
ncbi:MAG TPA: isoaspartyl peptidase/L-asparaginase [Ramlibacter sp.]|jgi:beta-aspartyl-peptidase (threonine type)|uniref:isoaspartyl peptidase/L-asparaginase family protein n=1 Tax=Ramlibacter sp. TaxID=1917967 RepID=UPI002D598331|nr:isoaspartyl peptidase/L-asparaginase [Ramlibacter sp.]HZY18450.1 isoaspartyl peptidase/L-asparaginase [Ramlibacter sp.]